MKVPDAIQCGALRLSWQARGDRAGHCIETTIAGESTLLLESIETLPGLDESAEWPPSPTLANWHAERRGASQIFMAVGLAGKTHWSASIEVKKVSGTVSDSQSRREALPDTFSIAFDIAARLNRPPGFLGSHYRCAWARHVVDAATVELAPGVLLRCDEATTRWRLDNTTCTLVIEPHPIESDAFPQTARWRYSIDQA